MSFYDTNVALLKICIHLHLILLIYETTTVSKLIQERGPRRTNEEIHRDLFENLAVAIKEIGFQKLTLQDVCRYANVRPNVIYHRYGSLNGLLEAFNKSQHDYWTGSISDKNLELLIRNPKEYYFHIADGLIDALYDENGWFLASLIWEMTDDNELTRSLAGKREIVTTQLTQYLDGLFANSSLDSRAINAILMAGIYYLIIRRERSSFNGIDFSSEEGRVRLTQAIRSLISILFMTHENNGILLKLIKEGLDDGILCRSYNITPEQLEFFKNNLQYL